MNGTIVFISELKESNSPMGDPYHVVELLCSDNVKRHTYTGPSYRNYCNWKPLLKLNQKVEGLLLIKNDVINADSPVRAL